LGNGYLMPSGLIEMGLFTMTSIGFIFSTGTSFG
jgi:hypothetical protein